MGDNSRSSALGARVAKKSSTAVPTCKACGHPMIMDETTIQGRGGNRIKRTFLHCVNEQCGHIERIADLVEAGE
jgi:RNase P subunit RPR2